MFGAKSRRARRLDELVDDDIVQAQRLFRQFRGKLKPEDEARFETVFYRHDQKQEFTQRFNELLLDPNSDSQGAWEALDTFRETNLYTDDELSSMEERLKDNLNPGRRASKLYQDALLATDINDRIELLEHYLTEFGDRGPEIALDKPDAANLYVATRLEKALDVIQDTRDVDIALREVITTNQVLMQYLNHTSDVTENVPIDEVQQVLDEKVATLRSFTDKRAAKDTYTEDDIGKEVEIVNPADAWNFTYRYEREKGFSVGDRARIAALGRTSKGSSMVQLQFGREDKFNYSKEWEPEVGPKLPEGATSLAYFVAAEVLLITEEEANPIRLHQYENHSKKLIGLLKDHASDHSESYHNGEETSS